MVTAAEPTERLSTGESLALDLVRGVAAQVVVVGHALIFFKIYPVDGNTHPFLIQNAGVVVFFVLSGFLISYTVAQKRSSPRYTFRTYFVDRFVRIFTAFAPALLFILAFDLVFKAVFGAAAYSFKDAFDAKTFAGNALMIQDFPLWEVLPRLPLHLDARITSFGSGRPLWTVAIEWWMYLLYGFLIFRREIRLPLVAKTLILAGLLVVPLWNIGGRGNGLTFVWFAGVAVFLLRDSKLAAIRPRDALVTIGILSAGALWRLRLSSLDVYDPLFAAFLAAMLLFGLVALRQVQVRHDTVGARVIRRVADYSFSLYLIHYSVLVFLAEYNGRAGRWPLFLTGLIASNVVAYAFAMVTEFHHKTLRASLAARFRI